MLVATDLAADHSRSEDIGVDGGNNLQKQKKEKHTMKNKGLKGRFQWNVGMCGKLFGGVVTLLLAGCATVEMAPYTVTSFPEVPLKKNASVRIVANDQSVVPIVTALKKAFARNPVTGLSVVDGKADYWFVLSGVAQYAKSSVQKKFIDKNENESGGSEVIATVTQNSSSAAKGVSVAVYETKSLTPVHYFEIPVYAGENAKGEARDEAAYNLRFSRDVFVRVKDAFLTQQKLIMTPIPLEADAQLRSLFSKGGAEFAKGDNQAYDAFLRRYEQLGTIELSKLCDALRKKSYEGSDADMKLGNQYLYLLVMEAMSNDPRELAKIKTEQLKILGATEAKGIAEAVPVALARLEYKLGNLVR